MLFSGTIVMWMIKERAGLEQRKILLSSTNRLLLEEFERHLRLVDETLSFLAQNARLRSLDVMESLARINGFQYILLVTRDGIITLTAPLDRELLGTKIDPRLPSGSSQVIGNVEYLLFKRPFKDDPYEGHVVVCIARGIFSRIWFPRQISPMVQFSVFWPGSLGVYSSDPEILPADMMPLWVSLEDKDFKKELGPLAVRTRHKPTGAWIIAVIPKKSILDSIFTAVASQAFILFFGAIIIYLGLSIWLKRLLLPLKGLQDTFKDTAEVIGVTKCIEDKKGDEFHEITSFIRCFTNRLKEKYAQERHLKSLLESERKRLQMVLEALPDPVCIINSQRRIVFTNLAMEEIFGDVKEKVCFSALYDLENPCDFCPIPRVHNGPVRDIEHYDEKRKKFFLVSCALVRGTKNNEMEYLFVLRDITKFKEYESRLVVDEKLRAVGLLAAGIAHDLNNVLAMIVGRLSLWDLDKNFPASMRPGLAKILEACERGSKIIQRLQRFRTPDQMQGQGPVALKSLIEEVIQLAKPKWKNMAFLQGSEFRFHVDVRDDLMADGIENELAEVFLNLIFNAIEAMKNGGDIYIKAWPDGDKVRVEMKDTGQGMDQKVLNRVFDPFFSTKDQGTGLGLSIVYNIIKSCGGTIDISSETGRGTKIRLTLPAAKGAGNREALSQVRQAQHLKGLKILVVDDETLVRELAGEMLKNLKAQPILASSGREALEVLGRQQLDMIMTDIGMPGMNGWQLAEKVRQLGIDIPIAFMSGYLDVKSDERLKKIGRCRILSKPFKVSELISVLLDLTDSPEFDSEKGQGLAE